MRTSIILAFYFFLQSDVPFKNSDEFKVQVDMKFKAKESEYKPNTFSPNGIPLDKQEGAEAFLVVNIIELKNLADEVRVQAIDSNSKVLFKKKCPLEDLKVEMGFLSDLKKGGVANEVTIHFLSAEKKELRKIVLTVLTDGTFQVNGKWSGQF